MTELPAVHMPGNPYLKRLVETKAEATPESLATLAVAFELRTANMIATAQLSMEIALRISQRAQFSQADVDAINAINARQGKGTP